MSEPLTILVKNFKIEPSYRVFLQEHVEIPFVLPEINSFEEFMCLSKSLFIDAIRSNRTEKMEFTLKFRTTKNPEIKIQVEGVIAEFKKTTEKFNQEKLDEEQLASALINHIWQLFKAGCENHY